MNKRHPLYDRWVAMRQRCNNPKHIRFASYGGRGITVCRRWDNFNLFIEDMLPTYKPGLTLDRRDNDGDYTPENCRWITVSDQNSNQRCRMTNISGYRGVNYHKLTGRWKVMWKRRYMGLYPTREEAIKKRKELEKSLH
jgi:hypothetical protein